MKRNQTNYIPFKLYGQYALAGLLLGVAFVQPWLWWLGLLGVVLLISAARQTPSLPVLVTGSLLAGLIQFGLIVSWLWNTYPLTGFSVSTAASLIGIGLAWSSSALVLGSAKLMVTGFVYFFKQHYLAIAALPLVWLLSDLLGSGLFSVISYGPGSVINTNFSFGWLGYLLAEHKLLLPISAIGGVFLLTIIYVSMAITIWWCLQLRNSYKWWALVVLMLYITTSPLMLLEREYDESKMVVTIETHTKTVATLNKTEKDAYYKALIDKVVSALHSGASYIILPEAADLTKAFVDDENLLQFIAKSANQPVVLVDSGPYVVSAEKSYVRAKIYDTKAMKIYNLDKQYLVPTGEFMPYYLRFLLKTLGFTKMVEYYQNNLNYVPGVYADNASLPEYIPGLLFCFESINPLGVKQAAQTRSVPFVAHPISHAWFHKPSTLWNQLEQMLRVNARFGGQTVYQAANGYSSNRY